MSSRCFGSCFATESGVDGGTQKTLPKNVEILSQTRVAFIPNAPLQQSLTALDLSPVTFPHYLSWAVFFHYDIDFQRLAEALYNVNQKYLPLCGRLSTDDKGRYLIEVGCAQEKQYDFSVIEVKANMQMAEGIHRHGKLTVESGEFPVHPDKLPFFLEPLNIEKIHKGYDPFLSVKLTHFSDGCCLAISISHLLVDGMRFSELYRDISRAYCGKDVHMRDINRQYMTLEGFSQQFTPEDKKDCAIPSAMPIGREPFTSRQYPNESSSLEILHLSKELINDMKSRVAQFIPEGSFVSTADLMNALLWTLECELNADCGDITNSTDLGIAGTAILYVAELCCNGLGVIPNNYFGNATIYPYLVAGKDVESKPLIELLASLALLTRQKQNELKQQSREVFKLLVGTCFAFTSLPDHELSAVSNFCKFVISDTDFGGGPPAFFLSYPPLPITAAAWFVSSVLHDDGILLTQTVTTKQKERLKKSSVLKECASGVEFLFDDSGVSQLDKLMKNKQR